MCGIAGIITSNPTKLSPERLKQMTDVIAHRGPDGEGQWISEDNKVGLGHRRLSIIDLSHEADQPMHYLNRYTLIFNGEIYNYIELRETLKKQGYTFHTQSDTEVLMALYDRDKENCLQALDGMFAFALYDSEEKKVFIARDRFGEKPFFYSYKKGESFLFASEMKSLWAGGIERSVNNKMLFNYLSFGYVENPSDLSETFFEQCTRLPHGHYMLVDTESVAVSIHSYYNLDWKNINSDITIEQAKQKFHELFYTSIKRRLRSDVAVGSSLSGGLDSSLIVCIIDDLKKGTSQKQNTFSAVFPGFEKDERKYMDYVIAQTKVNPHFVTPTNEGLLKDIDQLCWHQEEPFVSSSIYVQYAVMRLAKQAGVTVLLDGQGADEIIAGYHRYYTSYFNEWTKTNKKEHATQLQAYNHLHSSNSTNGLTSKTWGDRVRDISPQLVKPVKRLKNTWQQLNAPLFHGDFYAAYKHDIFETPGSHYKTLNEALYNSTMVNGIQQLLRYADRNSMAFGREVRLPFLNHELVEFLFHLPSNYKINQGWTKWIMRETFGILPNEIRWRKDKIGYEPPQKNWMDSEVVKQHIETQRNVLIEQNILNKKLFAKSIQPTNPDDVNTKSWLFWMAGKLF
jgi:asparagine synthase (glutamine-hydrolysing)